MAGGDFTFWLGAATHEPCGECPLRGAIDEARRELLKIPLEVVEKHLDRTYRILERVRP